MKNYFTIKELISSDTAKKLKIDNTPDAVSMSHLNEVIDFLNPIREAWGSEIIVTSGYRCQKLNKAVGGADTSVHKIGYAVDLRPKNGKIKEFKKFVSEFLKGKKFDQCLLEKSKTAEWVHIGLYNNAGKQRCQILIYNV